MKFLLYRSIVLTLFFFFDINHKKLSLLYSVPPKRTHHYYHPPLFPQQPPAVWAFLYQDELGKAIPLYSSFKEHATVDTN